MSGTDGGAGTVDGIVEEAGSRPRSWLNRDGNTAMMFRVNRRRKSADPTLFESEQPGDVGEHFLLAFQWGVPLSLTKKDVERRWQAGNRKVEQSTAMISGVIGFERDATGQDSRFDPASQSWVEEPMPRHLGSQAPFLFDPITRNLLVMRHPDFSVGGTAHVFEQILERGEMLRDPLSPTDWDVDPVLDDKDWDAWLAGIDRLESVTYLVRLPNPDAEQSGSSQSGGVPAMIGEWPSPMIRSRCWSC